MSDKIENPLVFPFDIQTERGRKSNQGISLRDYFAAAAMPAHCSAISGCSLLADDWHKEVARLSYATADAMLKARGL